MMLNMTEADYESWRDDIHCGGREEYDAQYSAASLYEGGWRSDAISDLIEQFNLTGDEAERIYNELLEIEQKAEGKVAGTIPQRGAQSMDKIKFFNQQLNSQIVMAELEAEHLAKSIRLLSEGDDDVAWAGEVANYATTLSQLAEVLTALRKVAHDSEILMEREEKA